MKQSLKRDVSLAIKISLCLSSAVVCGACGALAVEILIRAAFARMGQ
mgnify:CR=1 FL=1